jgi:hypothetical protein
MYSFDLISIAIPYWGNHKKKTMPKAGRTRQVHLEKKKSEQCGWRKDGRGKAEAGILNFNLAHQEPRGV